MNWAGRTGNTVRARPRASILDGFAASASVVHCVCRPFCFRASVARCSEGFVRSSITGLGLAVINPFFVIGLT